MKNWFVESLFVTAVIYYYCKKTLTEMPTVINLPYLLWILHTLLPIMERFCYIRTVTKVFYNVMKNTKL